MKSIRDLIPDIYALISQKDRSWFDAQLANSLSTDIAKRLKGQLGENAHKPTLRLSRMGPTCPCALWYSIHHPELAETIPPWATIKYSFGHVLEALAISLAKSAGHSVVGEQDELELDGIIGHRDCVIDGCTVDVKSSSSIGFKKFKMVDYSLVDTFGYLDQLDGYVCASHSDPLVTVKDKGYILAIDKQLGHLQLYEHTIRPDSIRDRIAQYKRIISLGEAPKCNCGTQADGASGNVALDVKASYNPYKYCCFPGLRTFRYANGPVYLTTVKRVPDVPEIFRPSQTIH